MGSVVGGIDFGALLREGRLDVAWIADGIGRTGREERRARVGCERLAVRGTGVEVRARGNWACWT